MSEPASLPTPDERLIEQVRLLYGAAPAAITIAWPSGNRVVVAWRDHSPDYRSCRWNGEPFTFTPQQAAVVKLLWTLYERGTPEIGERTLLAESGSDADRVIDIFRLSKSDKENPVRHPAYGKMVVLGTSKGSYRLAD